MISTMFFIKEGKLVEKLSVFTSGWKDSCQGRLEAATISGSLYLLGEGKGKTAI